MFQEYFEYVRKYAIIGVILLAIFLRLYHLDYQSAWGDEIATMLWCSNSLKVHMNDIITSRFGDVHPPFYYLMLHLWIKLTSPTPLATRSLAGIFGILSVYMIFLLGKEISRRCVGTLAAFILSVSPLHIYYSQEGRQYTFMTFAVLGSFLFFTKIIKDESKNPDGTGMGKWVALFLFNLAGIYTHYYFFLGLFVQFIFLLIHWKKRLFVKWIVLHLILFVCFFPWLLVFLKQLSSMQPEETKLMSRFSPIFSIPFILAKLAVFGNEFFIRDHLIFYGFSFLVFTASFILGTRYFYRDTKEMTLLLLMSLFVPIIIVYLVSLAGMALYSSHPFIMFSFPLYLLIARIVMEKKIRNYFLYALVIFMNIFVLFKLVWSEDYTKPKVKEVFDYIEQNGKPDDLLGKVPQFLPGKDAYDVWTWQYYNNNKNRMIDLSGEREEVIAEKIIKSLQTGSRIWIGFSTGIGNDNTLPNLTSILKSFQTELDHKTFSSKIRGNTIDLYYYEKTEGNKKSLS
ncbi:glycosyltransferase family 39 protein, partial [bacterium]|nr:glycosyltransferase family 39 protein [bacterium]